MLLYFAYIYSVYIYLQEKFCHKEGRCWISFSITNMTWEIVSFLMWTSYSESIKIDRTNEGLDTVPRNMDTDVTHLILDNNNLVTLNSNSFDVYVHLTMLSLRKCKTTYILDGTFDNQDSLSIIWLNRCNIIQLPLSFGPSTTTMEEFEMFDAVSLNIFRHPYFAAFINLKRLVLTARPFLEPFNAAIVPLGMERLRLDYSKLYTFPDFRLHTRLNILTIVGNVISTIPQERLDTLLALTRFMASKNVLRHFPSLSHMKQLQFLEIWDNKIPSIPHENISGLQSLENLNASYNLLELMPNISYLTKLELTDFSNNLIQYIPASCLYGLPMIQALYLNGNRIFLMDDNSWHTGSLYLHDNMFTTPPDLYDMASASLTLRGNPLDCDQSLCWLRMWPFNKSLPTLDNFSCSSPTALSGILVMKTHPTHLRCYTGTRKTHCVSTWTYASMCYWHTQAI